MKEDISVVVVAVLTALEAAILVDAYVVGRVETGVVAVEDVVLAVAPLLAEVENTAVVIASVPGVV